MWRMRAYALRCRSRQSALRGKFVFNISSHVMYGQQLRVWYHKGNGRRIRRCPESKNPATAVSSTGDSVYAARRERKHEVFHHRPHHLVITMDQLVILVGIVHMISITSINIVVIWVSAVRGLNHRDRHESNFTAFGIRTTW